MTTNETYPVVRRDVLRTIGLGAAVGVVGIRGLSRPVAASSHITETIYLSHSTTRGGSDVTVLFEVDLETVAGEAVLTEVTDIGAPFQNVDAIAATPDGATVTFVDRNTAHLGEYDVSTDVFTDLGQITNLPTITVLAAYGLDGNLYVASNTTNKLYTVDGSVSPPVATEVGTITGATVNGADIVVDSTGTMFLHSNADDTLYTVDYQNPDGSGNVAATVVGADPGSSLTGLAVRAAGTGDLVGSSRADDAIVVLDKTDGTRTATFDMTLGGSSYSYTNGDMATGTIVDETCVPCDLEAPVKYEYVFEEDGDDADSEPDVDGFFAEDADDLFGYVGYDSKEDEAYEPVSVTFSNPGNYCLDSLAIAVKAGKETTTPTLSTDGDGNLVVAVDGKFAISYVEFSCASSDE